MTVSSMARLRLDLAEQAQRVLPQDLRRERPRPSEGKQQQQQPRWAEAATAKAAAVSDHGPCSKCGLSFIVLALITSGCGQIRRGGLATATRGPPPPGLAARRAWRPAQLCPDAVRRRCCPSVRRHRCSQAREAAVSEDSPRSTRHCRPEGRTHSVGSPPNCHAKGLPVRAWCLRGLYAKIPGPFQDKSDRVGNHPGLW